MPDDTAASVPLTFTLDRAEPGVWFVTGDLGTFGPFDSPADAFDRLLSEVPRG